MATGCSLACSRDQLRLLGLQGVRSLVTADPSLPKPEGLGRLLGAPGPGTLPVVTVSLSPT